MAIGSADEMRVWIRYCLDLKYVDEEAWKRWRDEYERIAKMLQGLIKTRVERIKGFDPIPDS